MLSQQLNGYWARVQFWAGDHFRVVGYFYVSFFLYIKSSCNKLFVVFLMDIRNKKNNKKQSNIKLLVSIVSLYGHISKIHDNFGKN